jgi:hypothetical protein
VSGTNHPLRPSVIVVAKMLFKSEERTIIDILTEECNGERLHSNSKDSIERIQLAVLKLSNGKVDKFLAAAELAQLDWRDALVSAGFGDDPKAHLKWVNKLLH